MPEPVADAAQWMAAAQAGSREALGHVLETFRGYLLLVANRQLDPELRAKGGASDLVQDTFLEAQRDFGQFHGASVDELRAWLRRLLLNNVANFTRHYRQRAKREVVREVPLEAGGSSHERGDGLAADMLWPGPCSGCLPTPARCWPCDTRSSSRSKTSASGCSGPPTKPGCCGCGPSN